MKPSVNIAVHMVNKTRESELRKSSKRERKSIVKVGERTNERDEEKSK